MKAVVVTQPRDASFGDHPLPAIAPDQVLVRVGAVGICGSDLEILAGTRPKPYIKYPVIPGHEWCGTVADVGSAVKGLSVGQRVAVEGHNYCRVCHWCRQGQTNLCVDYNEFGFTLPGGYAEYVAVRADLAHPFSNHTAFDLAALTEPAACAGHGVMRANVKPGDSVVVVGSGTVALLSVAWAKLFNPRQIIVLSLDRVNASLATAVGATQYLTVDDDSVESVRDLTAGRGAEVVIEAAGSESAVQLALSLACRGGTVVLMGIVGGGRKLNIESDLFCLNDLRIHGIFAYTSANFSQALQRIEEGLLNVAPLITHTFPLEQYNDALDLLERRFEPVVKILLKP